MFARGNCLALLRIKERKMPNFDKVCEQVNCNHESFFGSFGWYPPCIVSIASDASKSRDSQPFVSNKTVEREETQMFVN